LCEKNVKINDYHFDLSPLEEKDSKVEHVLSTHPGPGVKKQEFTFNFCRKIKRIEQEPDYYQCKDGTFFCERSILTDHPASKEPIVVEINHIGGDDDDPLQLTASADADPQDESKANKLTINMWNKNYKAMVTLECSNTDDDPTYVMGSHEKKVAELNWKTKTACGQKGDIEPPPVSEPDKTSDGTSRWSTFFIIFFLGFGLYIGLGALYNSRTYHARGWDLLPHSDFWRELPYLIKDFVMAVYNSISSRRHGGYMSV